MNGIIIKDCPFCGSRAQLTRVPLAYGTMDGWTVECEDEQCYAAYSATQRASQDAALAIWNERVN